MKIWIGICLLWLMGRVALATDVTFTQEVESHVAFDSISRAAQAVEGLVASHENSEKDQTKNILKALNSYRSTGEFLRAPLSDKLLPVPAPKVSLNRFEKSVYKVLAQRTLYPYVRVIYDLSGELKQRLINQTYLLSREERIAHQKSCFIKFDYSKECIVRSSLEEDILSSLHSSLRAHQIKAQASKLLKAVISILSQEGSSTTFHNANFLADASMNWIKGHSGGELLAKCLSEGGDFSLELIAKGSHCKKVFEKKLFNDGKKKKMDQALVKRIERSLFGPYSEFTKLKNSLLEEALPYSPLCFGGSRYTSCRFRKFKEHLRDEWSDFSELTTMEQSEIVKALVYNLK